MSRRRVSVNGGEPDIRAGELESDIEDADLTLDKDGIVEIDEETRNGVLKESLEWVMSEWPQLESSQIEKAAMKVANFRLHTLETGTMNYREAFQIGKTLSAQFGSMREPERKLVDFKEWEFDDHPNLDNTDS